MGLHFFYQWCLGVATVLIAPYLVWQWAFRGKYRGFLLIRLGLSVPKVGLLLGKKRFWVHAVSLGEMKVAKTLIEALVERYPEHQILVSTLTNTGFQEAKKIPHVTPFLLPSDLYSRRLMEKLEPEALFLVEGDIWPNLVKSAPKTVVVNGKISQRTTTLCRKIPFLRSLLLDPIDLWLVQSSVYQKRLESLQIPSNKIEVLGDLKTVPERFVSNAYPHKGILIVSSHKGEEELLLNALKPLDRLLFLAPRHPERFLEVKALLEKRGEPYTCHSTFNPIDKGVVLIDAIGVLAPYYHAAPVTIVGGSFLPGIGGHNLLEPAFFGSIPVFGPFIEKQLHLKALLEKENVCFMTDIANLKETVSTLWTTEKKTALEAVGREGASILKNTLSRIEDFLS